MKQRQSTRTVTREGSQGIANVFFLQWNKDKVQEQLHEKVLKGLQTFTVVPVRKERYLNVLKDMHLKAFYSHMFEVGTLNMEEVIGTRGLCL